LHIRIVLDNLYGNPGVPTAQKGVGVPMKTWVTFSGLIIKTVKIEE